ncbi:hypothetical protein OIU74_017053 [Salix koriyanagi]|uniref:Uncharacterized protein n=1 Tax=Salix koriyanagi TaxID=2511006 RepID=A0A9Q0PHY9_9ROSI|nr:hypothetical protein OIU74_017053 [Salix koriyanagi]
MDDLDASFTGGATYTGACVTVEERGRGSGRVCGEREKDIRRKATVTASLPPLAASIAADLDGATLSVIGGGTIRFHITHRHRTSSAPPGGGGRRQEVVREYSNNSGFQRRRKIYEGTDDVKREQMDVSHGHSKPYLVSNFVQAKEQLPAGSENVVPVTTNFK